MPEAYFSRAFFDFLKELERNNRREWFLQHKPRYERDVRTPMLRFISDFAPRLRKISPHLVANPLPTGGSMFRIYRDTRFGHDKSPYKTHVAAHFSHAAGKNVHAPGFYIQLGCDENLAGGGIWHPDASALKSIRDRIVADAAQWKKALGAVKKYSLDLGETLKRVPYGYDSDHPLAADLKRKDFVFTRNFSVRDVCSATFMTEYVEMCRKSAPYMAFLCQAVGQPF